MSLVTEAEAEELRERLKVLRSTVPGLDRVLRAVPKDVHVASIWGWLTNPNPDLYCTEDEKAVAPLDWLQQGRDPRDVLYLIDELESLGF